MCLAQIVKHDGPARDVLKHDVGVYEIEVLVFEQAEVCAGGDVNVSVGHVAEALTGESCHFVRNVDTVNLAEVAAHGEHEAAGSTADFESAAFGGGPRREAREFPLERRQILGGGGEEVLLGLVLTTEGDVKMRVLAGSAIPLRAHAVENVH